MPVQAITLDGTPDGNFPATDGAASAHHFTHWPASPKNRTTGETPLEEQHRAIARHGS